MGIVGDVYNVKQYLILVSSPLLLCFIWSADLINIISPFRGCSGAWYFKCISGASFTVLVNALIRWLTTVYA